MEEVESENVGLGERFHWRGWKCGCDVDVYYLVMINRFFPILSPAIKGIHVRIENMKIQKRIKKRKTDHP